MESCVSGRLQVGILGAERVEVKGVMWLPAALCMVHNAYQLRG